MNWLEKLQAAGAKATEEPQIDVPKAPRAPPAEIIQVTVTVRPANGNDPGEAALGYFTFEGGKVTMVAESGEPLGSAIPVNPDVDPRAIARSETVKRWNQSAKFWGRRLEYPRLTIV